MLTAAQLFTPEQSGVGLNPDVPPPAGTWLADLYTTAAALGLPTTAWQSGGPERTIFASTAVTLSQEDANISLMAQGGFLDYAASGTVSYTALNGVVVTRPVTPDPSNPAQNPTGALGWLDALGQSFYNVYRILATYATGSLSIANTTAGTLTYGVQNYHVANTSTGTTYANPIAISVPSSIIAANGGVITGVIPGISTTTFTTQGLHGLSPNNVVYIAGVNGISGVNGTFSVVVNVPNPTTFTVALSSSGTWTSAGTTYKCSAIMAVADVIGIGSNAAPGAVTTTVTQNVGVFVTNVGAWSAANYESNTAYATRIRLKLGALSPNGPSAAYEYFALSAQQILSEESPPIALSNGPIVKAIAYSNPQIGTVTTVIASSTPAASGLGGAITPGCAQLGVSNATNATPIVITSVSPHGLTSGNTVTISGVLGNTAANTTTTCTVLSSTTFQLDSTVGSGAYTGGGIIEGGDLGQVDALIQANVVPDSIVATTVSALAFPVAVIATVVVPQAYQASYSGAAAASLQALIASYPIGGNVPPGGTAGTIPISAVEGALIDAGVLVVGGTSYVRQVSSLTVNGVSPGGSDPQYPAPEYDAILAIPVITVVGV